MIGESAITSRDAGDPLAHFREAFLRPEGIIYLDGHSLGMMPVATQTVIQNVLSKQWGHDLIQSWNRHDWIGAPARIAGKLAALIGANPHEVMVADSTSINLYKLIVGACLARPERRVILAAEGDFPTDLYMIHGALKALSGDRELKLVPRAALNDALTPDVALLVLTQVDYRSSEVAEMEALCSRARALGVLTLWDISHSAGAVPVSLNKAGADLAVGCCYKYLNGGPGAPAYVFVAERWHGEIVSPLQGWMGHAAPFAFEAGYRPASGVANFQCGTPPILSLLALEVGIDLARQADVAAMAEKARGLGDLFIELTAPHCQKFGVSLASPAAGEMRGGHVALRFPAGYALSQALIARGVIGDFREPDFLRFGFSPLTLTYGEVAKAANIFNETIEKRAWDNPVFRRRALVT
jgi:kynureninase